MSGQGDSNIYKQLIAKTKAEAQITTYPESHQSPESFV